MIESQQIIQQLFAQKYYENTIQWHIVTKLQEEGLLVQDVRIDGTFYIYCDTGSAKIFTKSLETEFIYFLKDVQFLTPPWYRDYIFENFESNTGCPIVQYDLVNIDQTHPFTVVGGHIVRQKSIYSANNCYLTDLCPYTHDLATPCDLLEICRTIEVQS